WVQGANIVSHSRHGRAERTYRATLLTYALLAALLSLFIVAIIEQGAAWRTVSSALRDASALGDDDIRVVAELTLLPLAAGPLTYILAAQGIRLLRLSIYLRRFHRSIGERLERTAPLYRLSHIDHGADLPLALSLDARGRTTGKAAALARVIEESAHTLLVGT